MEHEVARILAKMGDRTSNTGYYLPSPATGERQPDVFRFGSSLGRHTARFQRHPLPQIQELTCPPRSLTAVAHPVNISTKENIPAHVVTRADSGLTELPPILPHSLDHTYTGVDPRYFPEQVFPSHKFHTMFAPMVDGDDDGRTLYTHEARHSPILDAPETKLLHQNGPQGNFTSRESSTAFPFRQWDATSGCDFQNNVALSHAQPTLNVSSGPVAHSSVSCGQVTDEPDSPAPVFRPRFYRNIFSVDESDQSWLEDSDLNTDDDEVFFQGMASPNVVFRESHVSHPANIATSFGGVTQPEEGRCRTNLKKKNPFLECKTCGKAFKTVRGLLVHTRKHSGERPYACDVCGKSFAHSSVLRVHRRLHTGERPYACDTCSKAFRDNSTLCKHRRVHTGEKPYICQTCGSRYSQSGNLQRHIRKSEACNIARNYWDQA